MVAGTLPQPATARSQARESLADARRQSLVQAAFAAIAQDGFEGLRTRSVAARAGVNIATLHYYFPTKEALIDGVAEHLSAQFRSLHGPTPKPAGSAALDRLRQEFSDVRFYRAQHPDLGSVMLELQLRGRRDKNIAAIVDPLLGRWRAGLEAMVRAGIEEGVFDPGLNPVAAGLLLASAFSSAAMQPISAEALEGVFAELERWLSARSRGP
jgi:AcrR family transcriptional regulator